MTNLNVALPENMKAYVDAQVEIGDFVDSADFVRDLIRRDQERRLDELRGIVSDARASGISTRSIDEIFAEAALAAKARGVSLE